MINIQVDEDQLKALYQEEIKRKLEQLEFQTLLMDSKQLCKMLSLSWPTVEKVFLGDPNFPRIRIGKKWLFNRKEVQAYINQWSIEVKQKKEA